MSKIKELEDRVSALRSDLVTAERELLAARIAAAGVQVGEIVKWKGQELKVTRVRPSDWSDKPWLYGNVKVKGGKWGNRVHSVYTDWEKP